MPLKGTCNPLTGKPFSRRYWEILVERLKLPAASAREELIRLVKAHPVVVRIGQTGSGKST